MSFDFKNKGRINHLIEELSELRYRDLHDISAFLWYTDDGTVGNRIPQGEPEVVEPGFRWKGWDRYNWLCTQINVPEYLKGEEIIGLFDFGVPVGSGNNGDFESLLYLNGQAYQGVDGNHREIFLEVDENGLNLDLKFRVWSGLSGGGRPQDKAMEIKRAQFGVLDHPTDDLYFLSRSVLETHVLLEDSSEYKQWLLNELVQTFCLIDYTEPRSQAFYESTKAAYNYLSQKMDGRGKPDVNVTMIGHTHIDVAWLWRLRHTREKAARSFSTVNRLMDKYEDYMFLQSQPQLYEYIKEDYPDIYEHIQKRAKEGRWEPSGAMWVECDCNVVSGESLVRQILVGKNFYKEEFDYESEFLWLPDVFGYSWAMPQILKKSGVDTFMTTKISWNDMNKMPYDTFTWRGMDGSEVTAHFVTTTDEGDSYYTYNGDTRPYAVKGVWDNYSNKDTNTDLLISYGYGDGGGGPNRDMIKTLETLNKIPGLPTVKAEAATTYFRHLNDTLEKNEMNGYLPIWDGELYLEFHRGTYTSQAYNKKMNRYMENTLRDAELFAVMAQEFAALPYDKTALLKAWKIVLCHQFHDILPGSSIKEVYEDSREEYARAKELIDQVLEQVNAVLYQPQDKTYTIFNNSNWVRSSYVELPALADNEVVINSKQQKRKISRKEDKTIVFCAEMAPFSFNVLKVVEDEQGTPRKQLTVSEVETTYYKVSWNESGQLTSIYDKSANRQVLPKGAFGNVLQVFEDKPRCFDAWELESTIDLKKDEVKTLVDVKVIEDEVGVFVDFVWTYHKSTLKQTMCLYQDKKRIDFKTTVDWQEPQKFLKVAFPVDVRATDARFDIQYGNIKRPITRNNSWEMAKFEVVAHKWIDLAETGYGVALLNDCKYGHDIKDNVMRLSLIKAATDPDYTADIGEHVFTYAILPHTREWYDADIEQESFDLNHPRVAQPGTVHTDNTSLIQLSQQHVSVDCIKIAEYGEDIIIRFHEFMGKRSQVDLTTVFELESWYECDLMERPLQEPQTTPISVDIKPYEIKTIALKTRR